MEVTWKSLKGVLSDKSLKAIKALKFKKMTPVQAACIPQFLKNKDVAVEAVTGSGKTLAFLLPMLEMLDKREEPLKKNEVGAVILTPTRELAIQISEVLSHFLGFFEHLTSIIFIGGANVTADMNKFVSVGGNIVIATPGRLEDMFSRKHGSFNLAASVKALEVLVMDEADQLLDLGFEASINTILSYLPKQRRTGLFSATQTDEVENLIRAGLRNPLRITVREKMSTAAEESTQKTPLTLQNYYMIAQPDEKLNQLVQFLKEHKTEKIMVFFSTCAGVDYFSRVLQHLLKKTQIMSIHGKMKKKRNKIFAQFRQQDSGVLTCTDVMARGVDIPEIHWVIQFDPPSSASSFVHRCGRTARIGNTGNALIMLLPTEDTYINFIQINQKAPLERLEKAELEQSYLPLVQGLASKDRAVYEKGMRAFVSFVQSYAKHECSMIFRVKDEHISSHEELNTQELTKPEKRFGEHPLNNICDGSGSSAEDDCVVKIQPSPKSGTSVKISDDLTNPGDKLDEVPPNNIPDTASSSSEGGLGVVRGYESLSRIASEAELSCPSKVTSTNLRKYMATVTQVLDMKRSEPDWVCEHLGHTVDVHGQHNRARSDMIERLDVAKILLIQDTGKVKDFVGRPIQDIPFTEIVSLEGIPSQTSTHPNHPTLPAEPEEDVPEADIFENINIDEDDLFVQNLDFGKLATGFGLLRIPKMPELKGKVITNFYSADVNIDEIKYRDKQREKLRQEQLSSGENIKKQQKMKRPPKSVPWSRQKEKLERRKKRREKKERVHKRKLEDVEDENNAEDLDNLTADVRLIKRLKKKKISKAEFDDEFAGGQLDSDSDT